MRRVMGSAAVALLASGCPDDVVDNPFNATEGASSSSTGADDGQDGQDDTPDDGGPDTTAAVTGSSGSDGGSTNMVVDDSSGDGTSSTGSGDSGSSGESSSTGVGEESSSSTGEIPPDYDPCPEGMLPNAPLPQTVNGSSLGEDSEFGSTCGGGGAPDVAWLFTAPFDGDFTFDTQGSSIDTVLHVRDGSCKGPELECNDDGIVNTTQSMMSIPMTQDQVVTVVVDAFGLQGGNVQLTVREGSVSCPTDIGSTVPQTVSDQNLVALDEFTGSCGPGGAGADRAFLFTPPQDATYTFEITNNTFDTILYVLDGTCEGAELACNDNLIGTLNGASGFALGLPGGVPVTIVVDGSFGASGTFDLNIGMLAGTCPDDTLGNMDPPFTVSGSTSGEDNASASACGGLASADYSYTWTAPFEADFRFDTEGSSYDSVVYVLDGTCTGAELSCSNDTPLGTAASAAAHLTAGQDVVVVVDGNGAEGNFDLTVDVECPAQDLGSTVPNIISDQTLVADDSFLPSCEGFGGSQDQGFTFTAPAAGTYTFETANNTFDTVLSILDGVCAGTELACNDNLGAGGTGNSGLFVTLAQDQTVTAVVDGAFGASGTFDLVVGQLNGVCPDEDLGNMAAPFTVMGTTVGEDNAVAGSCGGLGSNDYAYTWTSPNAASYRFTTAGSGYDTVVYVIDGADCTGAELDCNNDPPSGGQQASVLETLAANQTVTIVVDGNGAQGAYTLTVEEAMDSGDCCFVHANVGCDDAGVEACVCAIDGFCCNTSWDGICVNEAINLCGAVCV